MSYLGRHARVSASRNVVWEIMRRDATTAEEPFTAREFYEKHAEELSQALKPLNPGGSLKEAVRGALQSLVKKGLLRASRNFGDVTYRTSFYTLERDFLRYNYGEALIEAQRTRIL